MKVVCAWCGKVLKEDAGEQVSHVICPECYGREIRPFVEEQRAFQPPPQEFDWLLFLHRQMLFSLTLGAVFFVIVLAAEGLHWMTGGKVPSLIEWITELPPATGVVPIQPEDDPDF